MNYLHRPHKNVLPELRQALVEAGHARYQGAEAAPARERARITRHRGFQRWRPLALGGGVSGIAAAVAAALLFAAGSAPTAAQAFPILAKPGTKISAQSPALAKQLHEALVSGSAVASAPPSGVPSDLHISFEYTHTFATPGYSGYVAQSTDG